MVKKCTMAERNKVWKLKEKNRPEMNTVLNKKTNKFEHKPKSIAKNKRFVKLNNRLNQIDRCLGRGVRSATLTINKKGIIKQRA